MKTLIKLFVTGLASVVFMTPVTWAGNVTIPNNFTPGTKALAAEVNANFSAVETAVDDNDGRIAELEALVISLQSALATKADINHNHDANYSALSHNHDGTYSLSSHNHAGVYAPNSHGHAQGDITGLSSALGNHTSQISAINSSEIMALDPYVTVVNDNRGPIATFSGLNLQLVNGTGTTDGVPNGLGNFIIGYDGVRNNTYFCSLGTHTDQSACESNGYIWAQSHKTGSHYLIIGDWNNYSQYGGLVVGFGNTSNNIHASISGGIYNTASGSASSISGGSSNTASGSASSISGGRGNTASGDYSSITAGLNNTVTASSEGGSITGGRNNTASGDGSIFSVEYNSISGGNNRSVSGPYDWVAGSLWEDQ
jgi:hypothetical protein